MALRNLIPWGRSRASVPVRRERDMPAGLWNLPMERLLREVAPEWGLRPFFGDMPELGEEMDFLPQISVSENDKGMTVSAELPGMDEKDVEVSVTDDALTLRGEKKDEREEREGETYRSERWYGTFRRDIPLSGEYDADKAEASFSKGVLTVSLPRKPEAEAKRKRIQVKAE